MSAQFSLTVVGLDKHMAQSGGTPFSQARKILTNLTERIMFPFHVFPNPDYSPDPIREIYDWIDRKSVPKERSSSMGWVKFATANVIEAQIQLRVDKCLLILKIGKGSLENNEWIINPVLITIDLNGKVTEVDYDTGP